MTGTGQGTQTPAGGAQGSTPQGTQTTTADATGQPGSGAQPGSTPAGTTPAGATPGQQAATGTQNGGTVTFTPEQQEEINRIAAKARSEGRDSASKELEDKRKQEEKETEEKRLAEQKKWEELAQKRQDDITALQKTTEDQKVQLDTLQKQADRYKAALDQFLAEQRKGLPDHIIALLDKLDSVDQLEYIAGNAQAIRTPGSSSPGTPTRGQKPTPKPQQQPGSTPPANQTRRRLFGL